MATSWTQLLTNRLNALRSTGPKTAEGKARSSRNALKHGLSRSGGRLSAVLAEAVEQRKADWHGDYRPDGPMQQWHFDRFCTESIRLEACEARICAARAELADRATESWDDDRAAEVATLASRLADRPEVIQPQLLRSKHGVLWLIERWQEVRESVTRHDGWTIDAWQRMLDLLGLDRLSRDGSGPWSLSPDDATAAPALPVIDQALDGLRHRLDTFLIDRDTRSRLDAESGLSLDDPPELRRLERYAADARRHCSRHLNALHHLQSARSRPTGPVLSSDPPTHSSPFDRPIRTNAPPRSPVDHPDRSHPAPLLPPAHNEPIAKASPIHPGSLRHAVPASSTPLNRRDRRDLASRARRS